MRKKNIYCSAMMIGLLSLTLVSCTHEKKIANSDVHTSDSVAIKQDTKEVKTQIKSTPNTVTKEILPLDECFTYEKIKDGIRITGYLGGDSYNEVTIPSKIDGLPVVELGSLSKDNVIFSQFNKVKKIIIPNSVKVIGNKAFYNTPDLEEVVFGSNVTIIGREAFYFCSNLKEIELPHGLQVINEAAFAGTGLIKVILPSTVSNIEKANFVNPNLTVYASKDSYGAQYVRRLNKTYKLQLNLIDTQQ